MILRNNAGHPTNPTIELLIPWYHLGQFTNELPTRRNNQYHIFGQVMWGGLYEWEDVCPEDNAIHAYDILFNDAKDKETQSTGYNDWIPECYVVRFYIGGTEWYADGVGGLYSLNTEAYQVRCREVIEGITEGMAERASGDDSYFDYVPSEYFAALQIAKHFIEIWGDDTKDFFLAPNQKVWDEIAGRDYPIELIETYGERP